MSSKLNKQEISSIVYHDFFDYPLEDRQLDRWVVGRKILLGKKKKVIQKNGWCYLEGRQHLIAKRKKREKNSKKKLKIAKRAGDAIKLLACVKGVFITGSLAMNSSKDKDDIDLMIVCKKNVLWICRLLVYLLLKIWGISVRTFADKKINDKICFNIWLDEADLVWREKNIYTAHEIAQALPLVNKDKVYERFLWENRWIEDFWPRAVEIREQGATDKEQGGIFLLRYFEPLARAIQLWYMRGKRTREVIEPTRAIFHPVDRSKKINRLFKYYGGKT